MDDDEKKHAVEPVATDVEEGRITRHAEDVDTAMKYAHNWHEFDKIPPNVERRLRMKADLLVTPLLALVYALQFADKVSNGGASVMGLRSDLDMTASDGNGDKYSWVGVGFYLGEIIGLIFVWGLIQKFPPAKTTALFIVAWGIIMACSAGSQSYGGYIACRVLLGLVESVVTPAFSLVTTQWYRRDASEQFSRTNFWFGANGIGTIIGTSIAYGFYVRESSSIAGWRGLFICLGCLTIVVGLIFLFHIPDDPTKAWFLTEDEKMWQVERIRKNNKGFGSHHVKKYQAVECLKDPRWYLYVAIMFLASIPNGGLTNFGTITISGIIKNNGAVPVGEGPKSKDTAAQSLLMQLPQGGTEFVGCFLVGVISLYILKNFRMAYGIFFSLINVLALCLLSWGPNAGSQLFGLYAFAWVAPVCMIAVLSSIQSNTGGTTKTLVTTATFMQFYCGGNALGSSSAVFKASEEPEYGSAKVIMAACVAVEAVLMICLTIVYVVDNKWRDKKNRHLPADMDHPEFADLTDMENPEFRYAY